MRRLFAIGLVLLAFASAAQAQSLACRGGETAMVTAELLFGRNIGGRLGVTERRWSDFLAREVTPRFPDGLTVLDGAGQWRDAKRGLVRERSKLLLIVMPDDDAAREKIAAIVEAYKRRFRQDSVGVLTRPVCAAF